MGVPLITTFLPQIIITIILGAVSISIFSAMHKSEVTHAMENSLRGSLAFVEESIAGPFNTLRSDARFLVESIKRRNISVYRGDDVPNFPSPVTPTTLEVFYETFQEMRSMQVLANGTYAYIAQQFRIGRKNGTSATSTSPDDFHYGWSGVSTTYMYHHDSPTNMLIWSEGGPYPYWNTSELYGINEVADGTAYVDNAKYMTAATDGDGKYTVMSFYTAPTGQSFVILTYALPISYDPVTGYATNALLFDIDCGTWMSQYVKAFNIPATEITVVEPTDQTIMASSFVALARGYDLPNASDVSTAALWTFDTVPEARLRSAISALRGLGALNSLPHSTSIEHPKGSDDIYAAHPIRKAGLNLLTISVTKADHFYADGEKTSTDAIIICVVLIVVAIGVAVATAVLLSRPLNDLGERMALTASLREDETELQPSLVSQVAEMQSYYLAMKSELNRMKSFLPQSLLTTEDDNEDDADAEDSAVESTCRSTSIKSEGDRSDRGSTRSSAQSMTVKSGGVVVSRGLNLAKTVIAKRTAVAIFNMVGFLQHVRSASNGTAFMKSQREFLRIVIDCSKNERGVVDTFSGDHVVVSWNAVTNVASAGKRAAAAATDVCKEALQRPHLPLVSVGIALGEAMVGNMGTDDMQRFNIVGSAFSQAAALERKAAKRVIGSVKRCILVTRPMSNEVEVAFFTRAVDIMQLPGTKKPSIISSLEQPRNSSANDEWMYELQKSGSTDPFVAINKAYAALDADGAALEDALAQCTDDERAEVMTMKSKLASGEL